jgi:predicted transcriptional regulator
VPVSKAELARRLHRNVRVIGRLISHLRAAGVLASEAVFSASGAQIANRYRIADEAQPYEGGFATA